MKDGTVSEAVMTVADAANNAARKELAAKEIRYAALNLLARREHSWVELQRKLASRFSDQEVIEQQIQLLITDNLQSDERFVEVFVRSRFNKGHGPMKIKAALQEKGVDVYMVEQALAGEQLDWFSSLQQLSEKKYGDYPPVDEKERAKRLRFFQSRGFSFELVAAVL